LKFIGYIVFRIAVAGVSILPFPLLYLKSDAIAFFFQHILKYRRKVIDTNLNIAFPNRSKKERDALVKGIYKNLSDIMVESLKGFTMKPENIQKRYTIEKPAFIDSWYNENKNLILVCGHIGNWEWATYTFPLYYQYKIIGLVNRIKNKYIDRYSYGKRSSTGSGVIRLHDSRDPIFNSKKPVMLVYVADQNTTDTKNAIIADFFGVETHCLHGAEKMAKRNNWPVIHLRSRRIKRGHYVLCPEIITENPSAEPDGAITQKFMSRLEELIIEDPTMWLWSHKRWKRNVNY